MKYFLFYSIHPQHSRHARVGQEAADEDAVLAAQGEEEGQEEEGGRRRLQGNLDRTRLRPSRSGRVHSAH